MPGYTSVFVHVDSTARAMARVSLAARIAAASHCRLVGVCATFVPEPQWAYRFDQAVRYMHADHERRVQLHETLRRRFEAAVWERSMTAEWRVVEGDPVADLLKQVKEAGLLVAGQPNGRHGDSLVSIHLLEAVILQSGRPVLIVPYAGNFRAVGSRTVVAWDGGRECARALHDALPLLAGGNVRVLHVETPSRRDATPVEAATRMLREVGAKVDIEYAPQGSDTAIGERILSRSADFGADLVVMGAYGHGRFRERLVGGVTRTLIASMTVPVFMAH